jgi:glucose/arabinose dehydrogenase
MNHLLLSIGLATMLVLATVPAFTNFTGAREQDHDNRDQAAETAAAGPSVNDTSLPVELVEEGLTVPTAMAFLDKNRVLVLKGQLHGEAR